MTNLFDHGYALLIGVGTCAYTPWSLPVTVKDAQALHNVLVDPNLCAYPNQGRHVRLLRDEQATQAAILTGLAWLAECAAKDPEATVIVYYSGHGWLNQATGQYYLIQHDVKPFDLPATALAATTFHAALRQISARRLFVVLDCCHAAGMASAKSGQSLELPSDFAESAPPAPMLECLKQGSGRAIFSSSRGEQRSWVHPQRAMSIYTHHLLEALLGAGNRTGDGVVRLSDLMNYLGKQVPVSAQNLCHAEQTPCFDTATEDFPVALLRGGKGLAADRTPNSVSNPATQPPAVVGQRNIVTSSHFCSNTIVMGDQTYVQLVNK